MKKVPASIIQAIEDHTVFICHAHLSPDADSVGAVLALKLGLGSIGKHLEIYCEDSRPESCSFLEGFSSFRTLHLIDALKEPHDAYLSLDTGSWKLATHALPLPEIKDFVINIDHHQDNDLGGQIKWVDTKYAATCQMIYYLLKQLKIEITPAIADCLLMGILFDTAGFQNNNTDSDVLSIAAKLRKISSNYELCITNLFNSIPYTTLLTWGHLLKNLNLSENGDFAWTTLSLEEALLQTGRFSMGEFASFCLRRIANTQFAAVLIERQSGVTKGSIRARTNYDVLPLAHSLGGGGHRASAGIKIDKSLIEAEKMFLEAVKKVKIENES